MAQLKSLPSCLIRSARPDSVVDFDLLDRIAPALLTFDVGRATQKAMYGGELFLAESAADGRGTLFRTFFQMDRDGNPKGVVVIDLKELT